MNEPTIRLEPRPGVAAFVAQVRERLAELTDRAPSATSSAMWASRPQERRAAERHPGRRPSDASAGRRTTGRAADGRRG
jgi:hypothetical protein